ncbi:threonine transporter [Bradyrhizobium sp. ISRA435]|nr:threonine transporter [Bradyrhizobium sp. ISRA435]
MDKEVSGRRNMTFNGPLEAGVRVVTILGAAFPATFDIERLTAFDYLLVHTSQLGGPTDLHPGAPIQTPATEVRRKVVQSAILLMMTRDLVSRELHESGIRYRAGESAALFLETMRSPYLLALKERADWLVSHLKDYNDDAFRPDDATIL